MKKSALNTWQEPFLWSIVIFIVAMSLRLIFLFEFESVPLFSHNIMDMAYHHDWAAAVARGEEFVKGPFFRAPLYPLFLGAVYFLFGDNPWAIRIIQALMGSISAVLVYLIARRAFDNRTGLLAGLILAGWGTVIFYDAQLLIPSLIIFLDLWALYFLVKAIERPSCFNLIPAGICLGLSAIARPTILLFAAVLFFWMFLIWRKTGWRHYMGRLAMFLFAVALPILPVTVYNYVKSGEFTLIGTYGGLNFYIGNNLEADGAAARLPKARHDWWGMMEDAQRMAEYDVGHRLTPAQQSDYWARKTLDEITEHPGHFITLTLKKFLMLCGGAELANNFDLYFFAHQTWLMKILIVRDWVFFPWGIFFPLAVAGMILAAGTDRRVQLLLLFIIAYVPAVVLFFVTARYRLPIVPLLAIFAAVAITTFIYKRKELPAKRKTLAITLIVILMVFCNLDPFKLGRESDVHGLMTIATIYNQEGNKTEAERYYRLAIKADPHRYEPVNDLAMLLDAEGREQEAISLLEQGVKYLPDVFMLKYNLAYLFLSQKRYEEAIPLLEEAAKLDPVYVQTFNNIGYCYMKLGIFDKALEAFHHAIKIDPKYDLSYNNIGKIYYDEGRIDSALVYFKKAVSLNPSNLETKKLLDSLQAH